MSKDVKIEGVWMSTAAAAENVEETGCSPAADVEALEFGEHTVDSLLAYCLRGAGPDRVQGWHDYVSAIKAHWLSPSPVVRGVKVGPGW